MPRIFGLTGGIAMGKSTLAAKLRWAGRRTGLMLWLHDADRAVRALMAPDGSAYQPIVALFGDITVAGAGTALDRIKLGATVFARPELRVQLERILHPLVYARTRQFLARAARLRVPAVVLDIPLLFETNGETRCDQIVSVAVAPAIQRRRALARPGMTEKKFLGIVRAQVGARTRNKHADAVINTGAGVAFAYRHLVQALASPSVPKRFITGRRQYTGLSQAWPPRHRRHGYWSRSYVRRCDYG